MSFLYLALNLDTFFKTFDLSEKFILSFFFEQDQQILNMLYLNLLCGNGVNWKA